MDAKSRRALNENAVNAALADGVRDPGEGPVRPTLNDDDEPVLPPPEPEPIIVAARHSNHAAVVVVVTPDGRIVAQKGSEEMIGIEYQLDSDDSSSTVSMPGYERKMIWTVTDCPELTESEKAACVAAKEIQAQARATRAAWEARETARRAATRAACAAEARWEEENNAWLEGLSQGERLFLVRRAAGGEGCVEFEGRALRGWAGNPAGLLAELARSNQEAF